MTKNQIKNIQKLKQKKYRLLEKKFIIEGSHLIEECIKSSIFKELVDFIIIQKNFKNTGLIDKLNRYKYKLEYVEPKTFNKISDTENPEGIIGIINMPGEIREENLKDDVIICLDCINDPGNLGTILRTCWWFGIKKVIISKDSSDIYNPKVLRASQGAIFNISIKTDINLNEYLEYLYKENYLIYLTTLNTENLLTKEKFRGDKKYAIVFGNEVKGISKTLLGNNNYKTIKINSFTNCESLNVSVAAGIILSYLKLSILN